MKKVFIIAEAGVNHNGKLELARQLIDCAVKAGADAVKFQTFITGEVISISAKKASYQMSGAHDEESQLDMVRKLELTFDEFQSLFLLCKEKNIMFLSTACDYDSMDFIYGKLGVNIIKIPSGEMTNLPYLRRLGSMRKKIIMSTGMSSMQEIEQAMQVLLAAGTAKKDITMLQCNTEYPTPMSDVNLNAMKTLRDHFGVEVGYSDHSLGIEVPIAAVAMGASVIEKHFTIDKGMIGPDHQASLDPEELKCMVKSIRNIELALGGVVKVVTPSEKKNRDIARRSIVALRPIRTGEIFSEQNLTVKRPGSGISPMNWDDVIGETAKLNYQKDELIQW